MFLKLTLKNGKDEEIYLNTERVNYFAAAKDGGTFFVMAGRNSEIVYVNETTVEVLGFTVEAKRRG